MQSCTFRALPKEIMAFYTFVVFTQSIAVFPNLVGNRWSVLLYFVGFTNSTPLILYQTTVVVLSTSPQMCLITYVNVERTQLNNANVFAYNQQRQDCKLSQMSKYCPRPAPPTQNKENSNVMQTEPTHLSFM